ncbi:hypothetical protein ACFQX6_09555 [Streptosporangium lutulentum]
MERDGWILLQSVSPDEAAIWIADKRDAIGDPEFRAIYLGYDAAFDWSPDDPRLSTLADRTQRWIANRHGTSEDGEQPVQSPAITQLVTTSASRPGTGSPRSSKGARRAGEPAWHLLPRLDHRLGASRPHQTRRHARGVRTPP